MRCQDIDAEARFAAEHLSEAFYRIPSADVARLLVNRFGLSRRQVRGVIRRLVSAGELVYTYEHGCSFLEPSHQRPVRVGKKVVLVPADLPCRTFGEDVVVRIAPGASFGSGRHPTTRLAIQGIEQALAKAIPDERPGFSAVLDIGTGSGVLVIAAVKLGVRRGVGIDIDPCARFEARQNVVHNRLTKYIRVSDQSIDNLVPTGRFNIVVANMRVPTLLNMAPRIVRMTTPAGCIVLSGIHRQEMDGLLRAFRILRCRDMWLAEEKDWGAVVLGKRSIGEP